MKIITHYFDYKSPYGYLAQESCWQLLAEKKIQIDWLPYTLQIPKYLGDAKLDGNGDDIVGTRNDHQWRRVKYSYMDCRREANRRGLTVRGPKRIFDSSIAHRAFLYLKEQNPDPESWRSFHDNVYKLFWKRELNIEDEQVLQNLLAHLGFETKGFFNYISDRGREKLRQIENDAEEIGVFGVPSWVYQKELFWGAERLSLLLEKLAVRESA